MDFKHTHNYGVKFNVDALPFSPNNTDDTLAPPAVVRVWDLPIDFSK
jgi:hypothetical protein